MKYKVKKAYKASGEDGDLTPVGTELYLLAEVTFPQELRDQAKVDGIRDAAKMYLTYNKVTDVAAAMLDWKVENINEELIDLELEGMEQNIAELSELGFNTY